MTAVHSDQTRSSFHTNTSVFCFLTNRRCDHTSEPSRPRPQVGLTEPGNISSTRSSEALQQDSWDLKDPLQMEQNWFVCSSFLGRLKSLVTSEALTQQVEVHRGLQMELQCRRKLLEP